MTSIVGAVDATTVQIEGVVSLTSTRFDASAGATIDHGDLTGRDDPDQHPASAIDVDGQSLTNYLARQKIRRTDVAFHPVNTSGAYPASDIDPIADPAAWLTAGGPAFFNVETGDVVAVNNGFDPTATGIYNWDGATFTRHPDYETTESLDKLLVVSHVRHSHFTGEPLEAPIPLAAMFFADDVDAALGTAVFATKIVPDGDTVIDLITYFGGGGVALGETSSTAYRGDRGKTAYDHSQVVTGNPHGTTAADVGAAATSHTHAASAIASGTIDIARIPTGTTSTTVPFGNDSRFSDKVPLSTVDAAGDLLIGTANDTVGRLPIGTARKVLTSDGSTASWANAAGPSPAMYPVAVGQWFANPHESIFAQTTTLNRALYVPIWIPADVTAVDGIQIEVTTVGSTGAVVRLGLHLPHATTKFPDARLIDGGTVDATSGGGAAGVRSLTIATTPVTPNSLAYVTVDSQGATCALRFANSGLWLLAMGVPSATNTDCMKASSNFGWFEAGVSGGFGTTASPTYSSSTAAQVVVGLRRA